jgi:hypothetical protein
MSFNILKQTKKLLIGGVVLSLGLFPLPASAQISNPQVASLVEALRLAAPQTGREDDGLYSDWQIKAANIPRWSRQCIGRELTPADFEASPVTARSILVCVMGDVLRQQYQASGNNEALAVQRTASWWMTGDATRYNNAPTTAYTQRVLNFYQQQRSKPAASSTPATPAPQATTTPPATSATPAPQATTTPPATSATPAPQATTTPPATSATPAPQATTTPPATSATPAPQATTTPPAQRSSPPQPTQQARTSSSPISDAQVASLVEALRLSSPQTGREDDGLYSDWQVKADNIPRWSRQCIGREITPADFEASPVTARSILVCVMRDVLRDQYAASENREAVAIRRTAAWWMTGDPSRYNTKPTASYAQKVLDFYQQQRSQSSSPR